MSTPDDRFTTRTMTRKGQGCCPKRGRSRASSGAREVVAEGSGARGRRQAPPKKLEVAVEGHGDGYNKSGVTGPHRLHFRIQNVWIGLCPAATNAVVIGGRSGSMNFYRYRRRGLALAATIIYMERVAREALDCCCEKGKG
jgi:hypothetical protein